MRNRRRTRVLANPMPELPEIETIRSRLEPRIAGRKVVGLHLNRQDLRAPMPANLKILVMGREVLAVRRRAKYLLIDLREDPSRDGGCTLIVHLGMSGRLFFTAANAPQHRHDHVLIDFSDGQHLRLRDPRRFGLIDIAASATLHEHRLFRHLGVEPLDVAFDAAYLKRLCRASKAPIKHILMNAHKVVGVGNIYASEALFLAGVRPTRPGRRISAAEGARLVQVVKQVLHQSIVHGGTTFRDYVDVDETPGLHQLRLMVYDRAGKSCRACTTPIRRIVQVGRSSYYCPKCQL